MPIWNAKHRQNQLLFAQGVNSKRIYVPGRELLTDQNNSKYEQQHSGDSFPEMMKECGLCKKGEGNELFKNIAYHLPDLLYFGYH